MTAAPDCSFTTRWRMPAGPPSPTMEKCIPLTACHVMALSGERNGAGSTRRT